MTSGGGEQYVLAVDLGSGGPKVVLASSRGELLDVARYATGTILLPNGGAEQDPEAWWSAISDGVRRVVAKRLVPPERIVAVSCATQWSVTVPVDRAGKHLANAVHWMDSRGAPYSRAVSDGLIKVAGYGARKLIHWLRVNGGAPTTSGADVLAHILHIKHDRPELYRATYKFLEPMDYLSLRMSGKFSATHSTVFPYLITDNRNNLSIDYDRKLLAWSGIDRQKLPDLVPVDSVLGPLLPEVADAWGLPRTVQVVAGTGDSQAAVLGSGAVHDYQGHVCVGTSSWLSCHVPFKKTDLIRFIGTMPAAVRGKNMVVAEQGAAGKCLELFAQRWLFQDQLAAGAPVDLYGRIFELAAQAPAGSGGLIFLPWLNGAGPPAGTGNTRGGFLNQNLQTGREEALRAVLEGIAYNLRWVRDAVERFVKRRFDALNFIGGGAQSPLWCQIVADVLNRPIRQVAEPNYAIA
ncbi:MAG: FGGY-family carbohydrate kinase, partial [Planctomycetaceae bacterium]|nr:FGGY-family carbohydrate kinase [Planctomycetaceae bacterium]